MSKTIFIDIETAPGTDWYQAELADKVAPPANYKSGEAINKWWAEAGNAQKEKAGAQTALMPLYGQIVCISWAFDDGQVTTLCGTNEHALLSGFASVLQDSISPVDNLVWVGHNICGFDIPFLFLRAMVNDIRIPWLPGRNVKPWTPHVCDTLYEVAGTEFKGASLKNVAKVLGIQNPYHDEKDVTNNGELVKSEEGRAQLAQWCANDVRMTREIYRKLTGALPRDQEG